MKTDIRPSRWKLLAILFAVTTAFSASQAAAQTIVTTNYYYEAGADGPWDTMTANWATPNSTSTPFTTWVDNYTSGMTTYENTAYIDNAGSDLLTVTMSSDITAQSLVLDATTLSPTTSAGTVSYYIASSNTTTYNNLILAGGSIVQQFAMPTNNAGTLNTQINANIVAGSLATPTDLTITAAGLPGSPGAASFGDTTIDLTGANTFANLHIGGSVAHANAWNTVAIDNSAGLPSGSTVYFEGSFSALAVNNLSSTPVSLQAGNFVVDNLAAYTPGAFIVGIGATTGNTLTVNGVISGNGDLQFSTGFSGALQSDPVADNGTGTVILNNNSTYVGQTHFNASIQVNVEGTIQATVQLGIDNALPTGTDLIMSYTTGNGGIFDLHGFNQQVASLSTGVNGSLSYITNMGSTTSTLTIAGPSAQGYSQAAFDDAINDGSAPIALVINSPGATPTALANSTSSYSGGTQILGGTLSISADGDLGSYSNVNVPNNLIINGGTLQATASFTLSSSRNLAIGPATGSGTGTISVATGSTLAYGGVISDFSSTTGGVGGLTVSGGGTLSLGGTNTYTGPTLVSQGNLALGSGSSLAASSAVTVAAGGTLSGTGTASGSVAVSGAIAPGTSTAVGTLNLGSSLTLNGGGSYTWKLSNATGSPGSGYDTVSVVGGLTLNNTDASPFVINAIPVPGGATFDNTQTYAWTIISAGSPVSVSDPGLFSVNSSLGGIPGSSFAVSGSGNDLVLTYNPGSTQFYQWLSSSGGARTGTWDTMASDWTSGGSTVAWSNTGSGSGAWGAEFSGTPGTVTLGAPVTVAGLVFQSSGYTIAGSGSGSNTLTTSSVSIPANQTETISAPVVGSGFTLSGGGTLILSNSANSLGGTTTINAGTLQGNAASLASNISIASGATLMFDQALGNNGTYSNSLAGSGSVIKQNSGALALSGNNSGFTGAISITGGTLSISADAASGASAQLGASIPSIVNINGGTLQTTAAVTSPRSILVGNANTFSPTPSATFDVAGNNVVLNGDGTGGGGSYAGQIVLYNGGTFTITDSTSTPGSSLAFEGTGNDGTQTSGTTGTVTAFTSVGSPGMVVVSGTSLILGNITDLPGTSNNNAEIVNTAFGTTSSNVNSLTLNNANLTIAASTQADGSPILRSLTVTGNSSITLWHANPASTLNVLFSTTTPGTGTGSYSTINTPLTLSGTLEILPGGNSIPSTTNYIGVGTVNLLGNSTIQVVSNFPTLSSTTDETTFRQQSGYYIDNGYTTTFYGGLTSTTASSATQNGFALNAAGFNGSTQEATGYWIIGNAAGTQGTSVELGYSNSGFDNATALTSGNILVNPYGQFVLGQNFIYGWPGQTVTLNGGGCTTTSGALADYTGGATFLGTVALGTLASVDAIDAVSGSTLTLLGNITGAGTLNKQGAGTLVLLGTQTTATGGTQVGNGTLQVGDSGVRLAATLGTGPLKMLETSTSNNGNVALNFDNTAQTIGPLSSSFADTSTSNAHAQTITLNGSGAAGGGTVLTINETSSSTFGNSGPSPSDTSSIAGFGSVVLSAASTGTLTLEGANTYSGGTTIDGGTLKLDFTATNGPRNNILSTSGALTMGGGTLLVNGASSGGSNQTIASLAVAAGASEINNTSNGSASTLAITSGTIARSLGGTLDFTLPASGSIAFTASPTLTGGILGGWATVNGGAAWATISGSGPYILAAYNSATSVSSDSALVAGTNYDIAGSLTATGAANSLRFTSASATLTLSGTVPITTGGILIPPAATGTTITGGTLEGAAGADLIVSQNSSSVATIASTIADNGTATGLTLSGTGTLALTGANTYSGTTFINSGTLRVDSGGSTGTLGSGSVVIYGASATLAFDRGDTALAVGNLISGSGGVSEIGGGITTLTAANTFTGQATINNGVVQLGNAGALQNSTVDIGTNNGLAFSTGIGTFTIGGMIGSANEQLQDVGGGFAAQPGASPAAGVGGGNPVTLQVGNNNSSTIYSGVLSGSGSLTKVGNGTLTLTGANIYTGATAVNGGTLQLDFTASGAPASNILPSGTALGFGGGTLSVNGNSASSSQTVGSLSVNPGDSAIVNTSNGGTSTLTITSGTINRSVGGTLDFTPPSSGSISFTGTPALTGGILGGWATVTGTDWATISGGNVVALPPASYTNDTWAPGNNTTVTVNDTPASGSTTNSLRFNCGTANGTSSAGNLVTLSGTNVITSGGILISSNTTAVTTITGGTLEGSAGGDLIVIQNSVSNFTISSVIADNGGPTGLTKSGPGTLVLGTSTNASNTFTGPVYINQGTIMLNAGNGYGYTNATGNVFNASNVIYFGANATGTTATLNLNSLTATVAGLVSGTSALTEGFSVGFTGGTSPTGSVISNLTIAGSGTYDYAGALIDGSGSLFLTINGSGTQILSGIDTYSGTTTITSGTLQIGDGGTTGSLGTSVAAISDNGTLSFDLSSGTTVAVQITGSGTLTQIGSGATTLTATNNNYDGGTYVSNGTLATTSGGVIGPGPLALSAISSVSAAVNLGTGQSVSSISNAAAPGGTTRISVASGQTLTSTGSLSNTGTLNINTAGQPGGNVVVQGAPQLAANSTIQVNAGTLEFTNGTAGTIAGPATVSVGAGATLQLAGGASALSSAVTVETHGAGTASDGALSLTGATSQTVGVITGDSLPTATTTYSGNTTVGDGTHVASLTATQILQNSLTINAGSTVTIAPSGGGGDAIPGTAMSAVASNAATPAAGSSASDSNSDPFTAIQAAIADGAITRTTGQVLENRIAAIERLAAADPGLDVNLLESRVLAALPSADWTATSTSSAVNVGANLLAADGSAFESSGLGFSPFTSFSPAGAIGGSPASVPEPSSLMLIALGMVGLAALVLKRRTPYARSAGTPIG